MTGGVVSTTSSDRTTRSNWTCPLTVTVPANDHSPRRSQRSSTVLATPYAASRQAGRSTSRIGSSGLESLSEVSRWRFVPPPKMESGMSTSATRESPRSTSEGPRSNLECVTHVSERVSPISPVHTQGERAGVRGNKGERFTRPAGEPIGRTNSPTRGRPPSRIRVMGDRPRPSSRSLFSEEHC